MASSSSSCCCLMHPLSFLPPFYPPSLRSFPSLRKSFPPRKLTTSPSCFLASSPPLSSLSLSLSSSFPQWTQLSTALVRAVPQVDSTVLWTSMTASFNLIALCTFVVWMQKSGHLPADTPSVLSQVSFNLLIPCFLMSKVSKTIVSQTEGNLIVLPLMAVTQILVGAILGKVACSFMYRRFNSSSLFRSISMVSAPVSATTEAHVSEIHSSSSSSVEVIDHICSEQMLAKKEAIITVACAFGNSVTLPLVFLSGVLSPEDFNSAAGYLALFMVGWSPCLWTLGYQIISSTNEGTALNEPDNNRSLLQVSIEWLKRLMNPPLYGVLAGLLVGGTPLSHLFIPVKKSLLILGIESNGGILHFLYSSTVGILQPILEAASLLGSATVAVQAIVLASSLANSMPSIGHSKGRENMKKIMGDGSSEISESGAGIGINVDGQEISLESKAFWVICVIRLLVMPLIGLMLTGLLKRRRWLPPDPLCALIVLVVAAMPTAQNLVVLAQLRTNTRPLAGVLANLLIRQYLLSVVPLTIWMATFLASVRSI